MNRLLILLLSTHISFSGSIAHAQIQRDLMTYDVPPVIENQDRPAAKHWSPAFFQCTDDPPRFSNTSAVVDGKPAENLYRIQLATTCRPKPHMGFSLSLPVDPTVSTDPLKYGFTGVVDGLLQLSPENIVGAPEGYTAQNLPYGALYHVHTDKQTCDPNKGCHYKVRIASTLKIETDGNTKLSITNISDSITPLGSGIDAIVASHLKGISYAMTVTPSPAGYVVRYESSTLMDQGDNAFSKWVFKHKKDTLDSQSIERFDGTVQTGLDNFINLYSSAHPEEINQILAQSVVF